LITTARYFEIGRSVRRSPSRPTGPRVVLNAMELNARKTVDAEKTAPSLAVASCGPARVQTANETDGTRAGAVAEAVPNLT